MFAGKQALTLDWFVYSLLHLHRMKQDVLLLTAGEYYSRLFAVNFDAPCTGKRTIENYTLCALGLKTETITKCEINKHEIKTVSPMHIR